MNLTEKKYHLIEEIFKVKDISVLEKMEELLSVPKKSTRLTAKEKAAVEEAFYAMDAGFGISHDSVMKETRKRYAKYFRK